MAGGRELLDRVLPHRGRRLVPRFPPLPTRNAKRPCLLTKRTLHLGPAAIRYSGSPINTPESEEAARWRNYQSTLARLTMADFSDCSFNSALRDIIPSEKTVPSKHLRVYTSRPEQFGGHITAAAQWVMYPEEASYVYGHCKRKKRVDKHNPRDTWSMENWEIWKSQFAYFSREDGVDARARETARKALESMETVESNIHRP